jgi:hypothetical protein
MDLSFYANSSIGYGMTPNLELSGVGPDNCGYTTLIALIQIGTDEELFWLYPHSGIGGEVRQSKENEVSPSYGQFAKGCEIMMRS